jgi:hypothetical protein
VKWVRSFYLSRTTNDFRPLSLVGPQPRKSISTKFHTAVAIDMIQFCGIIKENDGFWATMTRHRQEALEEMNQQRTPGEAIPQSR